MSKALELTENTRNFQKGVKTLIDKGLAKNQAEIIKTLGWNKPTMSSVMNGSMNVPDHIFVKFKNVYKEVNGNGDDFKEKYIAVLEQQCRDKDEQITENKALIVKLRSYIDSTVAELQKSQSDLHALGQELQIQMKTNRSYGKAILSVLEVVLQHQQPKRSREKIRDDVDTMLAEALAGAN